MFSLSILVSLSAAPPGFTVALENLLRRVAPALEAGRDRQRGGGDDDRPNDDRPHGRVHGTGGFVGQGGRLATVYEYLLLRAEIQRREAAAAVASVQPFFRGSFGFRGSAGSG